MDMKRNISVFLLTVFASAVLPAVSFGEDLVTIPRPSNTPLNPFIFPVTPERPRNFIEAPVDDVNGVPVVIPAQPSFLLDDRDSAVRPALGDSSALTSIYISQATNALKDLEIAQRLNNPQGFPTYRAQVTQVLQDLAKLSSLGVSDAEIKAAQDSVLREYLSHVPAGQNLRDDPVVLTGASMGISTAISILLTAGSLALSFKMIQSSQARMLAEMTRQAELNRTFEYMMRTGQRPPVPTSPAVSNAPRFVANAPRLLPQVARGGLIGVAAAEAIAAAHLTLELIRTTNLNVQNATLGRQLNGYQARITSLLHCAQQFAQDPSFDCRYATRETIDSEIQKMTDGANAVMREMQNNLSTTLPKPNDYTPKDGFIRYNYIGPILDVIRFVNPFD